jgi:Chemotaxis signal transduction protein
MAFLQLVTFEVYDEVFAVDINNVNGILKSKSYSISKVPNAPKELEGFINLRGRVTPIYNLKKKFQYAETTITPDSKIIVIDTSDSIVGFIVDDVTDIFKIKDEDIEPFPSNLGSDCSYITGIGKVEGDMVAILDLIKLLNKTDMSQLKTISSMAK